MEIEKNSDIHLRPRFKMDFNESQQNLISKFEANLKDGNCKYCSKIVDGHIVIDVPVEENKFWFNGEILEVKIYHNSIETDDDLYLWFDFERNSKFKTFDKSGNGNHGELYETEEFKYEKHIEFNKIARPAKIV